MRSDVHDLSGSSEMLRVPYDLFNPAGPIELAGGIAKYEENGQSRTGRTARAQLADASPGERVLIKLAPGDAGREWWLCEVMEVSGATD